MIEVNELAQLLADLGEKMPDVEEIAQHGSSASWAVALEGDLILELELVDDGAGVLITCDVGVPASETRLAVYESLLQYNAMSAATGGVAMAISEPDGPVLQLYRLAEADLNLANLQAVVENLAAKAEIWRSIVKNGAAGAQDLPASSESLLTTGLRV
jgi:hypothetical protein